jgi:hypothetical protein
MMTDLLSNGQVNNHREWCYYYMGYREDYALWESVVLSADAETAAPSFRFGKYVNPISPRSIMRLSSEGRKTLLTMSESGDRGRSHEKGSDTAPFVAWDGEGITYEQGMPQSYVLFGSSTGNSISIQQDGAFLSTIDCLECILECETENPTAIHVGFAFKYDAEMILRDLSLRSWWQLRRHSTVRFNGYSITYHPGRVFRVSRKIGQRTATATIYDVWGFFQGSFIKALRGWLNSEELQEIEKIETGKNARGAFTFSELDGFVRPYWESELRLLVLLCERLRERMVSADMCPSQWHGAGALATVLYKRSGTRKHIARTESDLHIKDRDISTILPKEVNDAARYAYAGGRFELFKLGHTDRKVYQYDINSAYPNAIAKLPSFRSAEWEHVVNPQFDSSMFGVFRVQYNDWTHANLYRPGPLPHRDWAGRVAFPPNTTGWYWTPEVALIAYSDNAIITEGWICHHDQEYPFDWVNDLYEERRLRKANNDPSEKAYKLALNSLYGKMAQRLGWTNGKALPRFHQLEWAGWVTSFTRMQLYNAMQQAGNDLIAVETDAVFSLRPLALDCGTGLGQWEVTEHEWITYLQSGSYWSDKGPKFRGFDRDSISHDVAMDWLRDANFSNPIRGTTTRFVGAGRGLGTPDHRRWITEVRELTPGKGGKRIHLPELCRPCGEGYSPATHMHPLLCGSRGGSSFPHSLPWLDDGAPGIDWQERVEIDGWDAFE